MLKVVNLRHEFAIGNRRIAALFQGRRSRQTVVALQNISFRMDRGRTLAVVGESGSGKSTLGRCIVGLHKPSSGEITLDGVELTALSNRAYRPYQRKVQMVFQDPGESLNPRLTVAETLSEPLRFWRKVGAAAVGTEVQQLLELVQLDKGHAGRYPHQLSGGQQQRVGIARALAAQPEIIVLDEPTSALDVSVQAQILNLLADLQSRTATAYLLISHDLWTVRFLADEVIVLYLGEVMECGPVASLFADPLHPYTRALLSMAPQLGSAQRPPTMRLSGEAGVAAEIRTGCPLAPRCPLAQADCATGRQQPVEVAPGHFVACKVVTGA